MIVRYSSNNSGGDWWLSDEDWHKLEAAGRRVGWFKNEPPNIFRGPGSVRWLGALAQDAYIECVSIDAAIASFEAATGEDASAESCECCGPPHGFYEVKEIPAWITEAARGQDTT